jgi:hypothetical protein
MIESIEFFFYKVMGIISRRNKYSQRVIMKLLPLERIRRLNITTNIKLTTGELFNVSTKHWIGFRCFFSGAYDVEAFEEFHMLNIGKKRNIKTFFDVGANHGYYSLKFSSIFKEKIKIFSFPLCQDTCPLSNLSIQTKAGGGK